METRVEHEMETGVIGAIAGRSELWQQWVSGASCSNCRSIKGFRTCGSHIRTLNSKP